MAGIWNIKFKYIKAPDGSHGGFTDFIKNWFYKEHWIATFLYIYIIYFLDNMENMNINE